MKRPVPMAPPRPIITTWAWVRPLCRPCSRSTITASSKRVSYSGSLTDAAGRDMVKARGRRTGRDLF